MVISKIQVSDPGPSWPSCLTKSGVFIGLESRATCKDINYATHHLKSTVNFPEAKLWCCAEFSFVFVSCIAPECNLFFCDTHCHVYTIKYFISGLDLYKYMLIYRCIRRRQVKTKIVYSYLSFNYANLHAISPMIYHF